MSRDSRDAERSQQQRHRHPLRGLVEALGIDDREALPPEQADDGVALRQVVRSRGDHFADAEAAHHRAELHRRDVRVTGVHPAAHRRIERQVPLANDGLTGRGLRNGGLKDLEVGELGQTDRPRLQQDLQIRLAHRRLS